MISINDFEMQELRMVGFVFYVINFVLRYLINFQTKLTLQSLGEGRGEWGQFDPPPCDFSKTVFSRVWVKPWFLVTCHIIIRHIFPEKFIEIP